MAAAHARAAAPADGVDLVDEDDARRVLLGLLKRIAHAAGAHAHEHLHEIGTGDGHEGHARLARDGLGQQRLAGAGRAHEQHALGDARADLGEAARVLEELDQLLHLFLFLDRAGHVRKRDLVAVRLEDAGCAVPEVHHLSAAAVLLAHHEHPEEHEAQRHDDVGHHLQIPRRVRLRQIGELKAQIQLGDVLHRLAGAARRQLAAGIHKRIAAHIGDEVVRRGGKLRLGDAAAAHARIDGVLLDRRLLDHALLDVSQQLAVFNPGAGLSGHGRGEHLRDGKHHQDDQQIGRKALI